MTDRPARQAEPGQTFTYNDWRGTREFTADDKGVVRPADEIEEAACVAFGLPALFPVGDKGPEMIAPPKGSVVKPNKEV